MLAICKETITSGKFVCIFVAAVLDGQPQPFYGPFFQDHPGEPVPEENSGLYGAREDEWTNTQLIQ